VRDPGDGEVVLVGGGGHDDRPAGQREGGDVHPHLEVGVVLGRDHPHLLVEELQRPGVPPGELGAGHRVTADEAGRGRPAGDGLGHRALDAGDVGEPAPGGLAGHGGEHVVQRGQRDGQHDQGVLDGGAGERRVDRGGDVVAVGGGLLGGRRRGGRAPGGPAGVGGGAQQRAADEAEADHAHGAVLSGGEGGTC
jgi:hypothetical protein